MKSRSTHAAKQGSQSITRGAAKPNPRLADKWYEYLDLKAGAAPATIDHWLKIANDPPNVDGPFNFEIRNHRLIPGDQAKLVIDEVRAVISSVARLPAWAGYDAFDYSPFRLFLAVLETVPQGRIRFCVKCDRYFFAKRKDKRTCSPECANVVRVQRYRKRWREYEQNRKRNWEEKEKRAAMKADRRSRELATRPYQS